MYPGTQSLISSCSGWCLKGEWWCVWKETTIYTLKGAAIGWAKKMEWSCWKLESRDTGISSGRKILKTVTVVTSKIEKLPKESMNLTRSSKQTVQSMNCTLSLDWWGSVRVIKRLPVHRQLLLQCKWAKRCSVLKTKLFPIFILA